MTCKAELHIYDDYGDNRATMHCDLDEGHEGKHRHRWRSVEHSTDGARHCVVEWLGDDREREP